MRNLTDTFIRATAARALKVGTYETPINWEAGVQTLLHRRSHQLVLDHPEDSYYEMKEYIEEFGDPRANGKNHQITTIEDEHGNMVPAVLVPARRIHKLKKRKVYEVDLRSGKPRLTCRPRLIEGCRR